MNLFASTLKWKSYFGPRYDLELYESLFRLCSGIAAAHDIRVP